MKRLFLVLLIMLQYSLHSEDVLRPDGEISSAYNDYYDWSPPVNLGLEAGVTYNYFKFNQSSNLPLEAPSNYSQGEGFAPYVLGIIDYRINGFMGVLLGIGYQEVNYSNNSNTFDYTYSGNENSEKVKFNSNWSKKISYLNTNLALRYNLSHKLIFNLGAFFNYKLSETGFENKLSQTFDIDTLLYLRKMDEAFADDISEKMLYGITAGGEYRYYIAKELYLDFRAQYQFSLVNALKDVKVFPRNEKIYEYFEFSGRQNQLFTFGVSIIYKY